MIIPYALMKKIGGIPTANQILDLDFNIASSVFSDVAGTTLCADGIDIQRVNDQSGNSNFFTVALDTSDEFIYESSAEPFFAKRQSAQHLGADDVTDFNISSSEAITWYFVLRRVNTEDAYDHLLHMGEDYSWDNGYGIQLSSQENLQAWIGDESTSSGAQAVHPTGTSSNTIHTVAAVFDAQNKTVKLQLDAQTIYSDTFTGSYPSPPAGPECVIGSSLNASGTGVAFHSDVDIFRVLSYNVAHDDTTLTKVSSILNGLY